MKIYRVSGQPRDDLSKRDENLLRSKSLRTATAFRARPGGETQYQATLEGCNDARTGMPPGIPRGAMCVQRFDDSLNSAIHITYRISLRSSSMLEPRDPLLKVFTICVSLGRHYKQNIKGPLTGAHQPKGRREANLMARQSNKGRYTMGEELEAETPGSTRPLSR